ncbi:PilZ domain-containing protein [Maribrevibacterium harenarium]|uniref:PilZ domain-containing protein n=1 Tax=Maribrevibacterium harenarium TaxID=2589817 RepID=A0A501WR75_9GAMM|nr:PilZ domain-containing protein [Maribrevibacterium harenarium]TPE50870.1 PilZ domain-containing protein [Maribrevibacterium harenarium]
MEFVAHPKDLPLELTLIEKQVFPTPQAPREGFVGITCLAAEAYLPGDCVRVALAEIDPNFCVTGRIVWCDKEQEEYRIAIEFPIQDECYCVRMIEQLSQIEHYRRQAKHQGRRLNYNEAAAEWIQKFAASFPAFMS